MKKNNKIITILGGMGPDATIKLYQLLIKKSREIYHAKNNDDYPEILIDSIPVPDFISNNDKKTEAKKILIDRIKKLENLPICNFCLACNTAHILLPELQKKTKISFVSIIDEIDKSVKEFGLQKIGLLGSPMTIQSNLYQDILEKRKIHVIIPSKKEIKTLGKIISEIVAGNYKNTEKIIEIADKLKKRGAKGIILGCTELPLIFPKKYSLPIFDSLEILANELLEKYYNINNKTN